MKAEIVKDKDYAAWLKEIKAKIRNTQIKAAIRVNMELLNLYWDLGKMLVEKQAKSHWGDGVVAQLSNDLLSEFPEMTGFSLTNLKYIRRWYQFYSIEKSQQVVDQMAPLSSIPEIIGQIRKSQQVVDQIPNPIQVKQLVELIPWGHHIQIITKCKSLEEAIFYILETIKNNWSRNVLVHQIESSLYKRQGNAITNFELTLPAPQSDLARETLKNPYNFDFLSLGKEMEERDLENALISHIKKFILELGRGFAYIGNQYNLTVEDDEFFLDLLFYNYHLHCFVLFELKIDEFKPEYAGKLNFYINTVNEQIKGKEDKPTIGVLLCKTPNETVVKYALHGIKTPMGIADYELAKALPKQLKGEMPTIEELETELNSEYKILKKPIEQKLDRLKGMLGDLKIEKVKEKLSSENTIKIFNKVLVPLKKGISKTLEKEIEKWFENIEIMIWVDSQGFQSDQKAREHLRTQLKNNCGQFTIVVSTRGFKPVGTQAFNCSKDLYIHLLEYKFTIGFMRNGQPPILEKLYHQLPTQSELADIVEKFCELLIEDITFQVERITKKAT